MNKKYHVLAILIIFASHANGSDLDVRNNYFHYVTSNTYLEVEDNGNFEQTSEIELIVDDQAGAKRFGQLSLSFNPPDELIEIIDAGTKLRDGSVRKARVTNEEKHDGSSLTTITTIAFNNVDNGNALFYKIHHRHSYSPAIKNFSFIKYVSDASLASVIDIRIRHSRKLLFDSFSNISDINSTQLPHGLVEHHVTPRHLTSITDGANPVIILSTIRSYKELSAFFENEFNKGVLDARMVRDLAKQVVQHSRSTRESSEKLYDWVRTNIKYKAISFGENGYRPRDISKVLQERSGDCKDQVFLLGALLDEIGVANTPVLISTNLPEPITRIPTLRTFSHMIMYLPTFGIFVDPTTRLPFGAVPPQYINRPSMKLKNFSAIELIKPTETRSKAAML